MGNPTVSTDGSPIPVLRMQMLQAFALKFLRKGVVTSPSHRLWLIPIPGFGGPPSANSCDCWVLVGCCWLLVVVDVCWLLIVVGGTWNNQFNTFKCQLYCFAGKCLRSVCLWSYWSPNQKMFFSTPKTTTWMAQKHQVVTPIMKTPPASPPFPHPAREGEILARSLPDMPTTTEIFRRPSDLMKV